MTELLNSDWTLITDPNEFQAGCDLCIWDVDPGHLDWPAVVRSGRGPACVLLMCREDLEAFQEAVEPEVSIVLKPASRATLRAILGAACRRRGGDPGRAEELRAERDEMLQCLMQANLKLQEYDQERTNFVARAVHEFRAPLTAVCGYCGLLLERQLGPLTAEQEEVLKRIRNSSRRLSRMANALFQLSTAQKIQPGLKLEDGDLRECIEQAVHEVALFAKEKRIAVSVDYSPPPAALSFEKSQIEQVLINLLDNACKFTPRAGSVEIRGYPVFWERRTRQHWEYGPMPERRRAQVKRPNSFRIEVRDSGPGIPESRLQKVFEEYISYPEEQERAGSGLGLAICKLIVDQHQGRIWGENTAPGAAFCFVLPFREITAREDGAEEPGRLVHSPGNWGADADYEKRTRCSSRRG